MSLWMLEVVEQFKKILAEIDMVLVPQHMQCTFAVRHEQLVNSAPPIAELKEQL